MRPLQRSLRDHSENMSLGRAYAICCIVGCIHLRVLFGILNPLVDPPLPADSSDRRRFTGASIVHLDYLKLNTLLKNSRYSWEFSATSGFRQRLGEGGVENVKPGLTIITISYTHLYSVYIHYIHYIYMQYILYTTSFVFVVVSVSVSVFLYVYIRIRIHIWIYIYLSISWIGVDQRKLQLSTPATI